MTRGRRGEPDIPFEGVEKSATEGAGPLGEDREETYGGPDPKDTDKAKTKI